MSVLVFTDNFDVHAKALKFCLDSDNISCDIWCSEDYTITQNISLSINSSNHNKPELLRPTHVNKNYISVWARRFALPTLSSKLLHPSDIKMAKIEIQRSITGIRHLLFKDSIWINPLEKKALANIKALQLDVAKKVGFSIPDTLLSNDPEDIRGFWKEHNGNVIYKPYAPAIWVDDIVTRHVFTSKLNLEDLQCDQSLSSCPGIYQRCIEKKSELRVVVFGETCIAVRIHSQKSKQGKIDWRSDMIGESNLEPVVLSPDLQEKCIMLMNNMGLIHGSIDLIETDGDVIFLEVNEMGQFLWIENKLPQIPLLSIFAEFSLSPSENYMFDGNVRFNSFADFIQTDDYKLFLNQFTNKKNERQKAHPFVYNE